MPLPTHCALRFCDCRAWGCQGVTPGPALRQVLQDLCSECFPRLDLPSFRKQLLRTDNKIESEIKKTFSLLQTYRQIQIMLPIRTKN